jgi:ABC-type multidrug transport system fused ATPase/permease subunit
MERGGAASITFEDVSFAYPNNPESMVLNHVSFHIPAGAFAAIVGESGAGKSTVIGLLLRVHDPSAGRIFLDGIDLRAFSPRWLRRHVGLVAQTCGWLPHLRVRENLALGNVDAAADMARQRRALGAACAGGIVDARPNGLEAALEAHDLSGGERQRLAIARAMMKLEDTKADALAAATGAAPLAFIMDEATSALDVETEREIQRALTAIGGHDCRKPPPTTVAVAHRLSTVRHATHVIVMGAGGFVLETGSFAELARQNGGTLARLVKLQESSSTASTTDALFARLSHHDVSTDRLRAALDSLMM